MSMKLKIYEKRRTNDGGHRLVPTDRRVSVSAVNLAELREGVIVRCERWVKSADGISTETTELAGVFAGRKQLIGVYEMKEKVK